MSETERNKAALRDFAARFSEGDWDAVAALMADDFRWVVPAAKDMQSPSLRAARAGPREADRSKAETLEVYRQTARGCVDGRFTIMLGVMLAEGDRVAAEAQSHAVNIRNGRTYANRYMYLTTFRDGKMTEFREYQDTLHAFDVWMAS